MSRMINGVHHIAVKPTAEQYEKTVKFYTELLGLEVVRQFGNPELPILMISCGDGTCMEIVPQESPSPAGGALAHIAFSTDKVDEVVEIVRKAGYPIKSEPKDADLNGFPIRNAFFFGPVGEEIELFWEK